jgi:hypothetical protein
MPWGLPSREACFFCLSEGLFVLPTRLSFRFIVGLLALTGKISPGGAGFLVSTGLEFTSRILYVVRAINQNELNSESLFSHVNMA